MAVRVQYRRMSAGGTELTHITNLKGTDDASGGVVDQPRSWWVEFVDGGKKAYVLDEDGDVAYLRTNVSAAGTRYVETRPDKTKRDNLLRLPLY